MIDEIVGHLRGDDFTLQAVVVHLGLIALGEHGGEQALQMTVNIEIVRHVGVDQVALQGALGVGDQHRQLRQAHALVVAGTLFQDIIGRQELKLAINLAS